MSVRPFIPVGSLVLVLASATACDLAAQSGPEGTFERTLTVAGPVTLEISTGAGSIEITGGPDDSVHVIGRIRASAWAGANAAERIRRIEQTPPIAQDEARIRIGHTGDDPLYRGLSLSHVVRVPADTTVQSRAGSGSQTIADLAGPVDVQSGSGAIVVRRIRTDVRASTGSGSIRIEEPGGSLTARSGSGSITARGAGAAVDVRTGSGSIAIEGRPGRDWDVASASGSVRLALAGDAAFALDARSASGSITTTHPLARADAASRRRLRGTVRSGGPTVDVATASGSIRIE